MIQPTSELTGGGGSGFLQQEGNDAGDTGEAHAGTGDAVGATGEGRRGGGNGTGASSEAGGRWG
jgi:hypothetical protein